MNEIRNKRSFERKKEVENGLTFRVKSEPSHSSGAVGNNPQKFSAREAHHSNMLHVEIKTWRNRSSWTDDQLHMNYQGH